MKYGIIVERLGPLFNWIELNGGFIIKKNYNQLFICEVPIENPLIQTAPIVPLKRFFVTFSIDMQEKEIPVRPKTSASNHNTQILINPDAEQVNSRIRSP